MKHQSWVSAHHMASNKSFHEQAHCFEYQLVNNLDKERPSAGSLSWPSWGAQFLSGSVFHETIYKLLYFSYKLNWK